MSLIPFLNKRSFGSVFLFRGAFWQATGWGLFTISWLLPNHYHPWGNFHSEAAAFVALALLMAVGLLTAGVAPLRWPTTAVWILGAGLIPWLQFLVGISPFAGDALMASYYLAGWGMAVGFGYCLAQEKGGASALTPMHMLWIAAMVSAMLGLIQWLKLEEYLGIFVVETDLGDPVMGNLAQPNQLGTLLLMGMVAYAYIYERYVVGKTVFALGIAVLTAALVLTHSRAGMVGVVAISAFLLVKNASTGARFSASQIIAWLVLFGLMTVASPYVDHALHIDVQQEPLFAENGRLQIWSQTIEGIRLSPWVGYGWNQTFSATALGALRYPGTLVSTYAHNVLLDMVAWNGLPVGIILIGVGGYWFLTRLARVRGILATYAMATLLPFTIHSMVEYSFSYSYFLLVSGIMIGVVEASLVAAKEFVAPCGLLVASFTLWVIIGVGIARDYMLLEEDVRVTAFENLRVGATDPAYKTPEIGLLTHMATLQRATRLRPVPYMTTQQLHDMRRAVLRFPGGGLALRYAMALGMNGDPLGARHTMAMIRGVYGAGYFKEAKYIWNEQAEKNPVLKNIGFLD